MCITNLIATPFNLKSKPYNLWVARARSINLRVSLPAKLFKESSNQDTNPKAIPHCGRAQQMLLSHKALMWSLPTQREN